MLPIKPDKPRDQNLSIGSMTNTAYGSRTIGIEVMRLLLDESPLMLAVDAEGHVYALDPLSLRAQAVESQHMDWIVGIFTRRCGRGKIIEELRERAFSLKPRKRA